MRPERRRLYHGQADRCMLGARQVTMPDPRVMDLVKELAEGPIPDWNPPPTILVLNKVCVPPPASSTAPNSKLEPRIVSAALCHAVPRRSQDLPGGCGAA